MRAFDIIPTRRLSFFDAIFDGREGEGEEGGREKSAPPISG